MALWFNPTEDYRSIVYAVCIVQYMAEKHVTLYDVLIFLLMDGVLCKK